MLRGCPSGRVGAPSRCGRSSPRGRLPRLAPSGVFDADKPLHPRQRQDRAGLGGWIPDHHLPAQLLHDGVPPHDQPQPRGVHEADGGEVEDELGGAFFKEGGVDALTDGGGGVVVDLPADADGEDAPRGIAEEFGALTGEVVLFLGHGLVLSEVQIWV